MASVLLLSRDHQAGLHRSQTYPYGPTQTTRHQQLQNFRFPQPPNLSTRPSPPTLRLQTAGLSMDSRYGGRPLSPTRRHHHHGHPLRSSTSTLGSYDPAYYTSSNIRDGYTSPRTSNERVIPISTTTYVTPSTTSTSTSSSRNHPAYEGYTTSTRPRSTYDTLGSSSRGLAGVHTPGMPRLKPSVVVSGDRYTPHARPSSPLARSYDDRSTFVQPASSQPSREHREHKKVYSVDDGKSTKLIDERDIPKRRDSYQPPIKESRKGYPRESRSAAKPVDDYEGYSYTSAADMYRNTEPAWRASRPRAGSLERSARPANLAAADPYVAKPSRDIGPPPTTRGFNRLNDGLTRGSGGGGSLREPPRRTSSRERSRERSNTLDDPGYAPPSRSNTYRAAPTVHQQERSDRRSRDDGYASRDEYEEPRESRSRKSRYEDPMVEQRGFGIRAGSTDRYGRETSLDRRPIYHPQDPILQQPPPPLSATREYFPPSATRETFPSSATRETFPSSATREAFPSDAAVARDEPRRDYDRRERDAPRDRDAGREYDRRERDKDRDRDSDGDRRDRKRDPERRRDSERERDRDYGYDDKPQRRREREREPELEPPHREERHSSIPSALPVAAGAALGAVGIGEALNKVRGDKAAEGLRDRHFVDRDEAGERGMLKHSDRKSEDVDVDDDYQRRVRAMQEELQRSQMPPPAPREPRQPRERDSSGSDAEQSRRRRDRERDDRDRRSNDDLSTVGSTAPSTAPSGYTAPSTAPSSYSIPPSVDDHEPRQRTSSQFTPTIVDEPTVIDRDILQNRDAARDTLSNNTDASDRSSRVRIVEPPKSQGGGSPPPKTKGILKQPTQKFPEDPNPIREGVAPLKDAKVGKDIPPDARWTKIDRRLVNPQALVEAKERFEERMDCVIVLRVLTKEDIQKLADRTREIRETREDEPPRERRERRSRRKDDRDYDEPDSDDYDLDEDDRRSRRKERLAIEDSRDRDGRAGAPPAEFNKRDRERDEDYVDKSR